MTRKKGFGLGSALDEAFTETVQAVDYYTQFGRLEVLPLHKIEIDPENPRRLKIKPDEASRLQSAVEDIGALSEEDIKRITKELGVDLTSNDLRELEKLFSLAGSIKQQGVLNPIIVYPFGDGYRIAAGERRFLASILASQKAIQSRISDEKPNDTNLRRLQWAENIEREDLTLWEKLSNLKLIVAAEGFNKDKKVTPKQLGKILGCHLRQAYNYHSVLYADDRIQEVMKVGALDNIKKCSMLTKIADKNILESVLVQYDRELSVSQLKTLIDKVSVQRMKKTNKRKGRGAQGRVQFGYTTKPQVARYFLETIVAADTSRINKEILKNVNWDDFSEISVIFQQVVKELTKMFGGEGQ